MYLSHVRKDYTGRRFISGPPLHPCKTPDPGSRYAANRRAPSGDRSLPAATAQRREAEQETRRYEGERPAAALGRRRCAAGTAAAGTAARASTRAAAAATGAAAAGAATAGAPTRRMQGVVDVDLPVAAAAEDLVRVDGVHG